MRARGGDVVGAQHLDHLGAVDPHDRRQRRQRQHEGGQHRVAQRFARRPRCPPASSASSRTMPVSGGGGAVATESWPLVGSQPSQTREHQLQQQRRPERRQRHAGDRDDADDVVERAVAPHRRQHAERHADADGEQPSTAAPAPASPADSGARSSRDRVAGLHGAAEIAVQQVGDIAHELLGSGRSSPYSCRTVSTMSRVASGPAASAAGSDGATLRHDEGDDDQPAQHERRAAPAAGARSIRRIGHGRAWHAPRRSGLGRRAPRRDRPRRSAAPGSIRSPSRRCRIAHLRSSSMPKMQGCRSTMRCWIAAYMRHALGLVGLSRAPWRPSVELRVAQLVHAPRTGRRRSRHTARPARPGRG